MTSTLATTSAALATDRAGMLPPGPRSVWLNTLRYATDYLGSMRRWQAEYGPTFTLRDLSGVSVVTSEPELIRRIFAELRAESFDVAAPPSFDVLVGKHSLLMLPGTAHQQRRKVLGPPFCREALPSWAQAMIRATRDSFAKLESGERFVALEHTQVITLNIICEVIFGAVGPIGEEIHEAILAMLGRVTPRFLVTRATQREFGGRSAFGRYMQASRALDRLLLAHVDARRRSPGESMLDLMLASTNESGEPLSDQAIVEELRTLLLGGHETTARTLAWALCYLHRDRPLLERVRREVEQITEPVALIRSPLLSAVIDEATRIRPVAGQVFRRLAEPMTLGPWRLPAGIIVSPAPCLVHLRPELWPEPERFDPDRFVNNPHPPPGTFIPFGGGTHRCIGATFARFEGAVVLATMLRELEFELEDTRLPDWIRDGLPLGPSGGVRMRLVGRRG